MSNKITYAHVKVEFEKEGYILATTEYKSAKSKLYYTCCNGHNHNITWDNWKAGYRCRFCKNEKLSEIFKKNINEVTEIFNKEGYILLTTEYKNNKQKLSCMCPKGHHCQLNLAHFKEGIRCFGWFVVKISGSGHPM